MSVEKVNPIGKVLSVDVEGFKNWRRNKTNEDIYKCYDWFTSELRNKYYNTDISNCFSYNGIIFKWEPYWSSASDEEKHKQFEAFLSNHTDPIKKALEFSERFGRNIELFYNDENFVVIGWGKDSRYTVPTQFVTFELFKTYDDVPFYKLPEAMGLQIESTVSSETGLVNLGAGLVASNTQSRTDLLSSISDAQGQIKATEEGLKSELEEIQRQADLKMQELRDLIQVKLDELNAKKKEFEVQLFGLDHQLYLLRCILGDSVEVCKLREGKPADVDKPVILYQKLRFLDEDMAKMKVVYCHNYDDEKFVEEVFATDDIVFNYFCPTDKCVTLIRISKDNKYYAKGDGNSLEKFAYYNGTRIALLVRNGENLHIVWTEDSRIYLKENFMYGTSESKEVDKNTKLDDDTITQPDYTKRGDLAWAQFFSRKFLMAILQGLVEYQGLLKFPEKVSFAQPNQYVVFSLADNQLQDNRFGTLSEYMIARNKLTKQGDYILPTMSISGCYTERGWGSSWQENHSRGRGDNNRVRGCNIDDEVCQINLVEVPSKVTTLWSSYNVDETDSEEHKLECKQKLEEFNRIHALITDDCGNIIKGRVTEGNTVYTVKWSNAGAGYVWKDTNTRYRFRCIEKEVFEKYDVEKYKYYVSVDKPEEWGSQRSGKVAVRSNVRIYPDEFINLTYLSSDVLTYFIENKKIGRYFGTNYAYAVKYLHKASKFIKEREQQEFIEISRVMSKDVSKIPHIEFLLSQWKFENKVRNITESAAKRFVKWLKSHDDFEDLYQKKIKHLDWFSEDKNGTK